MNKLLPVLLRIAEILGEAATVKDAIAWLQVEENAEQLRAEGHLPEKTEG